MGLQKERVLKLLLILSFLFVIISYIQFFIPGEFVNKVNLSLFWFIFYFVTVLICDEITFLLEKKSLLHEIVRSKKSFWLFILTGLLGGLLLDGTAQWLGKLWRYPYWSNSIYPLAFTGFCIYWLSIAESYLAVKAVLKRFIKQKKPRKNYKFENRLHKALAVTGIIFVIVGLALIMNSYSISGGYEFEIAKPSNYQVNMGYVLLLFFGSWFVLESIEYAQHKTSLLKDIFHHYTTPLLSILIASLLFSLFMETVNLPHGLWVYTHWPIEHIKFLGVPILTYVAWPLHYITFLSIFRVITRKESKDIWT